MGSNKSSVSNGIVSFFHKNTFKVSSVCFMTWLALGGTSAHAAIVVDRTPGQTIGITPNYNGSVTVNINPASGNGISHNKFSQFNVDNSGVVINNSAQDSFTKVGGNVSGNKNMSNGSASLIINEVTSSGLPASQLNGMIEVTGSKADIIIANPAGINCNGCGFLNVRRGTLTTGKVDSLFDNQYRINVNSGNIIISGRGMKSTGADYTSLLANIVKIDSDVRAKDLLTMTGKGEIIFHGKDMISFNNNGASNNPITGLDVATLGGMYADRITLLASQKGVGVNNLGVISADTDLRIDHGGTVTNRSNIISGNNTTIKADALNNYRLIHSGNNISMAGLNVINQGAIIAEKGSLSTQITGIYNNTLGLTKSGGSILMENNNGLSNNGGLISAGTTVDIVGGGLGNYNGAGYVGKTYVPNDASNTGRGGVQANDNITVNASGGINTFNSEIASKTGDVKLHTTGQFDMVMGGIYGRDIDISATCLGCQPYGTNYNGGKINASNDLKLSVTQMANSGSNRTITAAHDIDLVHRAGTNSPMTDSGVYVAGNNFNVISKGIGYQPISSIVARNDINIVAESFFNHTNMNAGGMINVESPLSLYNTSTGSLVAGKGISLKTRALTNQGTVLSPGNVDIYTLYFTNTGTISPYTMYSYDE